MCLHYLRCYQPLENTCQVMQTCASHVRYTSAEGLHMTCEVRLFHIILLFATICLKPSVSV